MFKPVRTFAAVAVCLGNLAAGASAQPCNEPFSQVYRQNIPAVARILVLAVDPFSMTERVRLGLASGVVIDGDGHIITNAHVAYGASRILARIGPDDTRPATLIGADPLSDIAVIRVSGNTADLPKARFGDSDRLVIGEDVLAIGHPFGLGPSAARGIISALGEVLPLSPMSWQNPLIQTDAAINPGNSGGPLIDRCGAVIGIEALRTRGEGVNFAIPSNLAREIAAAIIAHGRVIRPWYGIHGTVLGPELRFILSMTGAVPPERGLLVETVEPGSPADKIGLKGGDFPIAVATAQYLIGGDVITKVNGQELDSMDTVVRIVRSLKVGDEIHFEYYHDGQMHSATVTLPERPILPGDIAHLREREGGD
jgi:S1-C subfamily serine protease